jgi:chromosome transmission fidelity protein 8
MATATSTLIPIQCDGADGKNQDWILVELQGEVRSKIGSEVGVDDRKGKELGKLIDRDSDNPVLIIGNSRLEGKRMKLAKPFAILKKLENGNSGYVSKGIVHQKFVFKTRPKPLTEQFVNL